jgi:hypothetical protein
MSSTLAPIGNRHYLMHIKSHYAYNLMNQFKPNQEVEGQAVPPQASKEHQKLETQPTRHPHNHGGRHCRITSVGAPLPNSHTNNSDISWRSRLDWCRLTDSQLPRYHIAATITDSHHHPTERCCQPRSVGPLAKKLGRSVLDTIIEYSPKCTTSHAA